MDKYFMWIHYERLHNHNKAKHNKTVCIFLGIYCNECFGFLCSLFSTSLKYGLNRETTAPVFRFTAASIIVMANEWRSIRNMSRQVIKINNLQWDAYELSEELNSYHAELLAGVRYDMTFHIVWYCFDAGRKPDDIIGYTISWPLMVWCRKTRRYRTSLYRITLVLCVRLYPTNVNKYVLPVVRKQRTLFERIVLGKGPVFCSWQTHTIPGHKSIPHNSQLLFLDITCLSYPIILFHTALKYSLNEKKTTALLNLWPHQSWRRGWGRKAAEHISWKYTFRGILHDDVIKWKHYPRYWPFVRGIHRSPVNSPHKGQWRGALMFS